MQLKNLILGTTISIGLLLSSCSQKADQTIEYAINDIDITMEGPLFEGSNDVQASVNFNPDQVLQEAGLTRANIMDVRVKSLSLEVENRENFNVFQSILVQMTGGDASLASVALMNPVPQNTKELNPEVSDKASFAGFKNAQNIHMVVDANVSQEMEENVTMKGDIVFLIDVKK